ncbi:MAG TPA: hypothetical protein VKR56_11815 [Candidatus Cybelea sp.]|nr:hypothetical protein [Candidatus Cybelea sp.]
MSDDKPIPEKELDDLSAGRGVEEAGHVRGVEPERARGFEPERARSIEEDMRR